MSKWQDFTQDEKKATGKAKTIPNAPGVDVNTIAYNVKSGLSSNCCLSKLCPFYLVVNGLDFKRHI